MLFTIVVSMLNNIVETIVCLFNNIIIVLTAMINDNDVHASNNDVSTCAIFSCVYAFATP